MKKYNSKHFIINCEDDSLADKNIVDILDIIEKNYQKVISSLDLPEEKNIMKYFLYPSNQIKFAAMGDDGNGNAFRDKFEIHEVYNEKIKLLGPHEMTHLLTTQLGMPVELLRQGIAEAMEDDWAGRDHDELVRDFVKTDKYVSIVELFDDSKFWSGKYDDHLTYPTAGSFSKFLLKTYGLKKYKELYGKLKQYGDIKYNLKVFNKIMGAPLKVIEQNWLKSLCI